MVEKPWVPTFGQNSALPQEDVIVETKLDDDRGIRQLRPLQRRGTLWFEPGRTVFVTYIPTHWRHQ